jgi:hypothetical protein
LMRMRSLIKSHSGWKFRELGLAIANLLPPHPSKVACSLSSKPL